MSSHVAKTTKEKRSIQLKKQSRFACDDFPGISLLQFLCQHRLYAKDSLSCSCINIEKVYVFPANKKTLGKRWHNVIFWL